MRGMKYILQDILTKEQEFGDYSVGTILASTYVLHPDPLSQLIVDFGGKETSSDTEQEIQSLS